jgi:ADP-ribosylglycohydrolase
MFTQQQVRSAIFGVAVGDAIGVPAEFRTRESLQLKPITDISGYGTYHLPAGTWSDDSSLTFCLAEALTHEFDLQRIAKNFIAWRYHNYWTPLGTVFDIGIATDTAIRSLANGMQPDLAGGMDISSNGNGSLMRIMPLLFYIIDKPIEERFAITKQVSAITHGHIRSVIGCFYYLEFAKHLLNGNDKMSIYHSLQKEIPSFLTSLEINPDEIALFDRLLKGNIYELPEHEIHSGGYVLHTLEASIWCLLTTDNYKDAVLKSINLGHDTDTTAAVTGGLAGLVYGFDNIPAHWVNNIARQKDIDDLISRMSVALGVHG